MEIASMDNKRNTFEIAYEEAFDLACKKLLKKDACSSCIKAGAQVVNRTEKGLNVEINFLNKTVSIDIPEFIFTFNSTDPVHIWEKILILHYLSNAGAPLTGSLINYRQVKDGANYFSTFEKRSTMPFINSFGEETDSLIKVSKSLGFEEFNQGDVGIKINAFPFVPIYFIIWKGDEEFPPSGNILFDSSIENNLSAEDIAVLCQQIVIELIKIKNVMKQY
jgi:hypothetical protein